MRDFQPVDLVAVQEREKSTDANIRMGRYGLPVPEEFNTHRALLDESDLDRLYLIPEFGKHTAGSTALLKDVTESALSDHRVRQFLSPPINLQIAPRLELITFTVNPEKSPIIVGDGNHRIIAHFWTYRTVDGVPLFICSHPTVAWWDFCPPGARIRF